MFDIISRPKYIHVLYDFITEGIKQSVFDIISSSRYIHSVHVLYDFITEGIKQSVFDIISRPKYIHVLYDFQTERILLIHINGAVVSGQMVRLYFRHEK